MPKNREQSPNLRMPVWKQWIPICPTLCLFRSYGKLMYNNLCFMDIEINYENSVNEIQNI